MKGTVGGRAGVVNRTGRGIITQRAQSGEKVRRGLLSRLIFAHVSSNPAIGCWFAQEAILWPYIHRSRSFLAAFPRVKSDGFGHFATCSIPLISQAEPRLRVVAILRESPYAFVARLDVAQPFRSNRADRAGAGGQHAAAARPADDDVAHFTDRPNCMTDKQLRSVCRPG